jgi:hypothetical protein
MDDDELDGYERESYEEFSDSEENNLLFAKTIDLLRDVIDSAEWDNVTDEIIISAETTKGKKIIERFHSVDEMGSFLEGFGWDDYPSVQGGREYVFGYRGADRVTERQVDLALKKANAEELFFKPKPAGEQLFAIQPGLLIPEFKLQLAQVNEELIRYLASHPAILHSLDPRLFEELIGELFRDLGYEIIVTPRSRDGGVDIRAIQKSSVGTVLYLVECKRYGPERPVGVEIVRKLYGVVAAEHASCGVLATTSYFTADAKEFAKRIQYQLSLRDYNDLTNWLRQYPVATKRR